MQMPNIQKKEEKVMLTGIIPSLMEIARIGHHVLGFDIKIINPKLTVCLIVPLWKLGAKRCIK